VATALWGRNIHFVALCLLYKPYILLFPVLAQVEGR
jgi:hypothetical protein